MFQVHFAVDWCMIIHLQKQYISKFLITSYGQKSSTSPAVFRKVEFTIHCMTVFASVL